jgi:D-alanyl-D-alanine carboxypeptidase
MARTEHNSAMTTPDEVKDTGSHTIVRADERAGFRSIVGLVLAAGLISLVCGCRTAFTPLPPKETRTYQSILEWTHRNGMPGAVLCVRTPQTNFLGSVGWADVKRKVPMRPEHGFRIASATKMFLGIVAAQLHTEGRLNTDRVITNYLPASITGQIRNADRITVRHLVRHTSGIYNYTESLNYQLNAFVLNPRGDWPALRSLKYAYGKPAYFPPGEGFHYSNSNFALLGLILDRVIGHHHSVEIRDRILGPLQLDRTYYEFYEPPRGERTHGYERLACCTLDIYNWRTENEGDGGIVSTASDLAVFMRAVTGTNSFLNEATRRLLKSQPSTSPTDKPWYPIIHYDFGVGADRDASKGAPVTAAPWFFGHGGVTPGYVCMAGHEPSMDITIVYLGSSKLLSVMDQRLNKFQDLLKEALFGLAVEQAQSESERTAAEKPAHDRDLETHATKR